jgi:hypothetical protein
VGLTSLLFGGLLELPPQPEAMKIIDKNKKEIVKMCFIIVNNLHKNVQTS